MSRFVSFLKTSPYRVPVCALAAGVLLVALSTVAGRLHAGRILADIDLQSGKRPDVQIYLPFEPERFHLEQFQAVGRYLGWQQGYAVVKAADPAALQALARNYWVSDIRTYEGAS